MAKQKNKCVFKIKIIKKQSKLFKQEREYY